MEHATPFQLWKATGNHAGIQRRKLEHLVLLLGCILKKHSCLVVRLCSTFCGPHGLQPTWLLCPWNYPGKNTGVSCHFLLQRIFPTQSSNPCLMCLLHWQTGSLPLSQLGKPKQALDFLSSPPSEGLTKMVYGIEPGAKISGEDVLSSGIFRNQAWPQTAAGRECYFSYLSFGPHS